MPGEYKIWLEVNRLETNKLSFTLLENPNPIPTITSVSNWNPCRGDNVTITGTNFGANATVRITNGNFGRYMMLETIFRSSTSVVFSTDKIDYTEEWTAIEVISGGQVGQKTGVFQTKDCQ